MLSKERINEIEARLRKLRKKSHAISEALTDARELVEKLESEHETLIAQMSELEAYRAMVLPDYLPD